jgi:hypothetical protein
MLSVQLPPLQEDPKPPLMQPSSPLEKREHREQLGMAQKCRNRAQEILRALGPDLPGQAEWIKNERTDLLSRGQELWQQAEAAFCGPVDKFDQALARFAAHYWETSELYRTYLQNHPQRFLEGRRDPERGEKG